MNELTHPVGQSYSPNQIALDDTLFNQCHRLAQIMASGACTVPKHLQGNVGDCFAIIGQALRWGFDPYAVAQKTHLVNGTLGYEAQLIIAVINAKAPIVGRLKFEHYGDWTKVKTKSDSPADVGVKVSATLKGDDEPTVLDISMAQVGTVRNSPLWTADPRQQLAYLGAKRWARLHCPDVVLGLYSEDELSATDSSPKDITPRAVKNSGTKGIKDRIKAKRGGQQNDCYDISPIMALIQSAETMEMLNEVGETIADLKTSNDSGDLTLCGADYETLRTAWRQQREGIMTDFFLDAIYQATPDELSVIRQDIFDNKSKLGEDNVKKLNQKLDDVLQGLA